MALERLDRDEAAIGYEISRTSEVAKLGGRAAHYQYRHCRQHRNVRSSAVSGARENSGAWEGCFAPRSSPLCRHLLTRKLLGTSRVLLKLFLSGRHCFESIDFTGGRFALSVAAF